MDTTLKITTSLFLLISPLIGAEPIECETCSYTHCVGPDETAVHPPINNNLIDAEYLTPSFSWEFGFRLGLGYNSACDGWDLRGIWTTFRQSSSGHDEAEADDNQSLTPLWSSFQYPLAEDAPVLLATDIDTDWKLHLDLLDFELGRAAWNSHRLALRPHIGLRLCEIKEFFDIEYNGGSWNSPAAATNFTDWVELTSTYKGIGIRSGVDSTWKLPCGFALFGETAISIIYGRFQVDHLEYFRDVTAPFTKTRYFDTEDRFRASRATMDLLFGVEWSALFCECRYGFIISLAWEQHLFFHQNPFWRVERVGGENDITMLPYNDTGENVFNQREGSLSMEGWTLRAKFEF